MAAESIQVEVAYAESTRQLVIALDLPAGSTVAQAIEASTLLQQFPDIDLTRQKVGIFSQLCALDKPLQSGDRVEIYRPLKQDPMAARRARATN